MKRLAYVAAAILVFAACSGDPDSGTLLVEGSVKGLKKGTLYLQHIADTSLVTLDSVAINGNGDFHLETPIGDPDIYYLYLNKADGNAINDRIVFFAEPGTVHINTRWNAFDTDAEISGSPAQEKFAEYRKNQTRFHIRQLEVARAASGLDPGQDGEALDSLQKVSDKLTLRAYLYALNFALNNTDSYVAPFVAITEVSDANPKYLDSIYSALEPEVAASKYGVRLKKLLDSIQ